MMTKIWCSLLLVQLTGCAVVAEYPVTSASVAVFATTGKGPADHALSHVAGQDCATLRVIENERICQPAIQAEVIDRVPARAQVYQPSMVASANSVFAERAKKR